jgi:hypothetical protein
MIVEIKIIDQAKQFFSKLFQSKKEKNKEDISLLNEAYDLLMELESTWKSTLEKKWDLVDYSNLLLEKSANVRLRKNKKIAREIRGFAQRNCYAGVLPISESERIQEETQDLISKIKERLETAIK